MYKVFKAKASDFKSVKGLLTELFTILYKFSPHIFETKDVITFDEYKKRLKEYYLLKKDNNISGVMGTVKRKIGNKIKKNVFFVHSLVVGKKYRGKNGGKFLIDYVDKIKNKEKIDVLRLRVHAKNKRAYKFYVDNGFKKKSFVLELVQNKYKKNDGKIGFYKVNNASTLDFERIKSLMSVKENRIIDFYKNILNDTNSLITKKDFNNYLKNNLLYIVKEKGNAIASLGALITSVKEQGFIKQDILEIKFLLIDKKYKNKDKNFEGKIISSFINKIKQDADMKNIKVIKTVISSKQVALYTALRPFGFHKFSFDMEKKL